MANNTGKTNIPPPAAAILGIRAWAEMHKTAPAVLAGVCAAQGWADGKQVPEAVYTAAVNDFLNGGAAHGIR